MRKVGIVGWSVAAFEDSCAVFDKQTVLRCTVGECHLCTAITLSCTVITFCIAHEPLLHSALGVVWLCIPWVVQGVKHHPFLIHAGGVDTTCALFLFLLHSATQYAPLLHSVQAYEYGACACTFAIEKVMIAQSRRSVAAHEVPKGTG